MTPNELYILYGFLAFICLLLVTLIGIQLRQSRDIGELKSLIPRVERIEEQMGNLREQLGEARGMLINLNSRIDLLMRHHHNDAGQVVIVPAEEVAAAD